MNKKYFLACLLLIMIGFLLPFFFFEFDGFAKISDFVSSINTIASVAAVFTAIYIARNAQRRDSAVLNSSYDYDLCEKANNDCISLKIRVSNAGLRSIQIKSIVIRLKPPSFFNDGIYEENVTGNIIINPGCFVYIKINSGFNVKIQPNNIIYVKVVDALGIAITSNPTMNFTAELQEYKNNKDNISKGS